MTKQQKLGEFWIPNTIALISLVVSVWAIVLTVNQGEKQNRQTLLDQITEANGRYTLLQKDLWEVVYALERMTVSVDRIKLHEDQRLFAMRTFDDMMKAQQALFRLQVQAANKSRGYNDYDKHLVELNVIRTAAEHSQFEIDSYRRWLENQDVILISSTNGPNNGPSLQVTRDVKQSEKDHRAGSLATQP